MTEFTIEVLDERVRNTQAETGCSRTEAIAKLRDELATPRKLARFWETHGYAVLSRMLSDFARNTDELLPAPSVRRQYLTRPGRSWMELARPLDRAYPISNTGVSVRFGDLTKENIAACVGMHAANMAAAERRIANLRLIASQMRDDETVDQAIGRFSDAELVAVAAECGVSVDALTESLRQAA